MKIFDTKNFWNKRYSDYGFAGAGSIKAEAVQNPDKAIISFEFRCREIFREVIGEKKLNNGLYFGCGTGRFIPFLLEFASKIDCIDVSDVGINIIDRNFSFLLDDVIKTHILQEGEVFNFESGFFDIVFSLNTFVHVKEELITLYLSEILRVIKTGGIYIAVEDFLSKTQLSNLNFLDRRQHMNYLSVFDFTNLIEWEQCFEGKKVFVFKR